MFPNMYVVLTTLYRTTRHPATGSGWRGDPLQPGVTLVALAATSACFVLGPAAAELAAAAAAARCAALTRATGRLAGRRPRPRRRPGRSGAARRCRSTAPARRPASPAPAAAAAVAAGAGAPRPGLVRPPASAGARRPFGWLKARIDETPDPPGPVPRLLDGEGGGRFDRLDLWILVVLVVAAMGLRMFRLAEPVRMHFDEVYHARTATEFLQDWRYGLSHDIYEWTHPHLAKYAMAVGHRRRSATTGSRHQRARRPGARRGASSRGDADSGSSGARNGDRVWVVTGSARPGYDLQTRKEIASWSVPGASAITYDADRDRLYVGTESGELLALDVATLDGLDPGGLEQVVQPELVATLDGPITRLATFEDGSHVAAILPGDTVVVVDPDTGGETGRTVVAGAVDMAAAGSGDAIVATPADIDDAAAAASELAAIIGGDAADYEVGLADVEQDSVVVAPVPTGDTRAALQSAIDDGRLTGITIEGVPRLGVAGSDGLTLLTGTAGVAATVELDGGAQGLALVSSIEDGTQLYVTTRDPATDEPQLKVVAVTGDDADEGPAVIRTLTLPGAGTRVLFDPAAEMVEVMGTTPDGAGSTVYVVEPHSPSVFADQRVPFAPTAWVLDHNPDYPTANRGQILAFAADGATASLDVGDYAFAWRLPGVAMGAITVALLFLLARILFRRRSIAILVGVFALLDGMFFVQSRIAMNDVYVGAFILAAYCVFAWLWIKPERPRWAFWTLMPMIGLFLGLALASKWVAAYAIGALGILILARSALGRLLLIVGMIGLTGVLGWMGLAVPPGSGASGNLPFILIMIALTMAAVVVTVYHPIAWSDEEMWLAVAGPAGLGILIALGSILGARRARGSRRDRSR